MSVVVKAPAALMDIVSVPDPVPNTLHWASPRLLVAESNRVRNV